MRYQWATELLTSMEDFIPSFLHNTGNPKRYLLRLINFFKSSETDSIIYINECLEYFTQEFHLNVEHIPDLKSRRLIFDTVLESELKRDDFDYANEIKVLKRVFNSKSGVVVSTCHGVKGEEYDTVIAFGLLDGYIPNWNDEDKQASQKLIYVMCSRAKTHLHLISERGHNTKIGERSPTPALSRIRYSYDVV